MSQYTEIANSNQFQCYRILQPRMTEETKDEEAVPLISTEEKESYLSVGENELDSDEEHPPGVTTDLGSADENPPTASETDVSRLDEKKKTTRKGIKMDYDSTLAVEIHIQKGMLMHTLAAEHFQCRHFWFFEVQQGFLTMISSILAFIATTELVEARLKIILTTIVGSTTIVVGFLQAMNGLCAYGTRAVMHQAVALDLRDMRNNLRLLRCKLGYIETHHKGKASEIRDPELGEDEEDRYQGTFESIQDKFEQSLFGCKSPIPVGISEAFDGLHSSRYTTGSLLNFEHQVNVYGTYYRWERLAFKQFDILGTQIIDYPFFPFFLPRASDTLRKSFARIKEAFKEEQELFYVER